VHLPYFVEVLVDLATVFSSQELIVNRFIELIGLLSTECGRHLTVPGCLVCWCSARGEHFRLLLVGQRYTEATEHFRETLALGVSGHGPELNGLLSRELTAVSALEADGFTAVSSGADILLCDLIESGDSDVRSSLALVLGKRLGL
jgi:hypothetical protein